MNIIFEPQRPQRSQSLFLFFFVLSVVFVVQILPAQDLQTLERQIISADSQIASLTREYEKEKKANEQRLQQKQMQQAYVSAERLDAINHQLNALKTEKAKLCDQWRAAYRKTVDELLLSAQDKEKNEKGKIGKRLQEIQEKNSRLCPLESRVFLSEKWRDLQIESYDGPAEIQQKLLLLNDISRELSVGLARLDHQHQEALREERTRERAEEFIQEGTLFNDGLRVRSPTFTSTGTPTTGGAEVVDRSSSDGGSPGGSPVTAGSEDWQTSHGGERAEKKYEKQRAELLNLQKEIAKKIDSFHRRSRELMNRR